MCLYNIIRKTNILLRRGLVKIGSPLVLISLAFGSAAAEPDVFTSRVNWPDGIAVDTDGHVFIHGNDLATSGVVKFDSDGEPIDNVGGIGTFMQFNGGHMEKSPISEQMLLLSPSGQVVTVDSNTLEVSTTFIDLRNSAGSAVTDASIYNTLTSQLGGLVIGAPTYGDFAVRKLTDTQVEFFISALTQTNVGALPFVLRVRADLDAKTLDQKVILMARRKNTGGFQNPVLDLKTPPGIAVNQQGTVLSTFPFPIPGEPPEEHLGGFPLGVIAFSAGFPEDGSKPRFLKKGSANVMLDSFGMSTDPEGNFYVLSGQLGIVDCTAGIPESSLVVIPAAVNDLTCYPSGISNIGAGDVAVTSLGGRTRAAYTTLYEPPRLWWRLQPLRRWSHEEVNEVFPRGA